MRLTYERTGEIMVSQSLRKSGRLFRPLRRSMGGEIHRRNPFVNQVVCFAGTVTSLTMPHASRNPFVNQVVCFAGRAQSIGMVVESQSLRKSGRLFHKNPADNMAQKGDVAIPS